jgi:hypothetical protein
MQAREAESKGPMTLKIENNIRLEDIEVFQANPGSLANLQDTDQQLGAVFRNYARY